jgi:hypothetical protein
MTTVAIGVESRKGAVTRRDAFRFPSPLIKPDVRISRIRLSDCLHHRLTSVTRRARVEGALQPALSAIA